MSTQKRIAAAAYEQLCKELSEALYEEDPGSMGYKVGAPPDEYDAEAARLASALKGSTSREDIQIHLQRFFSVAPVALIERIERALAKFQLMLRNPKGVK